MHGSCLQKVLNPTMLLWAWGSTGPASLLALQHLGTSMLPHAPWYWISMAEKTQMLLAWHKVTAVVLDGVMRCLANNTVSEWLGSGKPSWCCDSADCMMPGLHVCIVDDWHLSTDCSCAALGHDMPHTSPWLGVIGLQRATTSHRCMVTVMPGLHGCVAVEWHLSTDCSCPGLSYEMRCTSPGLSLVGL